MTMRWSMGSVRIRRRLTAISRGNCTSGLMVRLARAGNFKRGILRKWKGRRMI